MGQFERETTRATPKNGKFRPHFQDSIAVHCSYPPVALNTLPTVACLTRHYDKNPPSPKAGFFNAQVPYKPSRTDTNEGYRLVGAVDEPTLH